MPCVPYVVVAVVVRMPSEETGWRWRGGSSSSSSSSKLPLTFPAASTVDADYLPSSDCQRRADPRSCNHRHQVIPRRSRRHRREERLKVHSKVATFACRTYPGVQPMRDIAAELGVGAVDGRQQHVAVVRGVAGRDAVGDGGAAADGVVLLHGRRVWWRWRR